MYKKPLYQKTLISANRLKEGETIELKVKRMIANKEPIKDGSPLIYTESKDGVRPEFNVRTDRFEIAADAMDKVNRSKLAKREEISKKDDAKVIDMKDGKPESTAGKAEDNTQSK